jgi:disulfide bond formation protein DsbB
LSLLVFLEDSNFIGGLFSILVIISTIFVISFGYSLYHSDHNIQIQIDIKTFREISNHVEYEMVDSPPFSTSIALVNYNGPCQSEYLDMVSASFEGERSY